MADDGDRDDGGNLAGPARRRSPGSPGPRGRRSRRRARLFHPWIGGVRLQRVRRSRYRHAPPAWAASATSAGWATFGVSFTIRGAARLGAGRSSQAQSLVGPLADDEADSTLGQEMLSSIAATSSCRPRRRPRRASRRGSSPSPREADQQRHPELGELGKVRPEEPVESLLGPIESIIPGRGLVSRGGGLPVRGRVIVFDTKAERTAGDLAEGRRAAMASNVPEPSDRVREAQSRDLHRAGARAHRPTPATSAVSTSCALTTGPSTQRRMSRPRQVGRRSPCRPRSRMPSAPPWPAPPPRPGSMHISLTASSMAGGGPMRRRRRPRHRPPRGEPRRRSVTLALVAGVTRSSLAAGLPVNKSAAGVAFVPEASSTRAGYPASTKARRRIASGAIPMPPPTRIAPAASPSSSAGDEKGRPAAGRRPTAPRPARAR